MLTSEADWTTRAFAERANLSIHEFHALLFIAIAEKQSIAMTAGDLRRQLGLSAPAVTYVVQRLTEIGYLHRDADPKDRRKVILRQAAEGKNVMRSFFDGLDGHVRHATADLPDAELAAAHRTFQIMIRSIKDFRAALGAE